MPEHKTLFLRNVPTQVVREAKAAAAREGKTLTAVVSEALARSLGVDGAPVDPADDLGRDIAWYQQHRPQLLRRYRGQYVAIVDGAVVDHGGDFNTLAARVFSRFGNRHIYMPKVQEGERVVRVASPRRVKP